MPADCRIKALIQQKISCAGNVANSILRKFFRLCPHFTFTSNMPMIIFINLYMNMMTLKKNKLDKKREVYLLNGSSKISINS